MLPEPVAKGQDARKLEPLWVRFSPQPTYKEEVMGKKLIGAFIVTAAVGGLLTAGPVRADSKKKQVDQITCEEFLALNPDDQQRIAYWVDGYETSKGEAAVGTVAFDKFGQPIGALVEDCKATPKETLWQKLKKHL